MSISGHRGEAPLRKVTAGEVTSFDRLGVVVLRGVLAPHWVERVAVAVDEVLTSAEADGMLVVDDVWTTRPFFRRLVHRSPVPTLVADLLRSHRVHLLEDSVMVKKPGGGATPWHQDQPYYPVDGSKVCTAWMPLDPATRENGTLRYVGGSHASGRWYSGPASLTRESGPVSTEFQDVKRAVADLDPRDILTYDLSPGDLLVHHGLTLHGAWPNASNRPRRAFACGYGGDDVRFARRDGIPSRGQEHGLEAGDALGHQVYPEVFRRAGGEGR